ncbi:MAG: ABC transporter ATP-binding protein [Kaiparowitsia implicata GSE-PSE-MK54-09C]|jgi:multiple sugar transport system ATP-binding protein|nr:ABC transporter ATP-binding protein [Kaiparowitsia implicata GSE-PSE-MK54-09C]
MTQTDLKPTQAHTTNAPALEVRSLNKTFAPTVVPVKNLNLTVERGEFLTLLGPSGCGKSTVLRMIAGLEHPTKGQVLIDGEDVTRLSPSDRNIAMVFQSYALYPHMTVHDNIASGLKLRRIPKGDIEDRIRDVVDFLGLHELLNRKPGQLSGGQRQRVAVARTLVRRPSVFLLDEPLSNLDALLRENVRAELKQLFESQQAPVVYVTHDQVEAMTLSSKVAVLNEGYLQQLDTPERIYTHPANRFVAGFVGSPQMNFLTLPCDGQSVTLGNRRAPLPTEVRTDAKEITLGIRPEHVRLAREGESPTVEGTVSLVEHLGMHKLYTVQVPGKMPMTVRSLIPLSHTHSDRPIKLVFSGNAIHWFDAETGDRLNQD